MDEELKANDILRPARPIYQHGDIDKKVLQKTISEFTEGKVTAQQRKVKVLGRNESLPKIAIYKTQAPQPSSGYIGMRDPRPEEHLS